MHGNCYSAVLCVRAVRSSAVPWSEHCEVGHRSPYTHALADRLEKEIKTARRKAVTLHDTLEGEAYNNGKKHDVGSPVVWR